MTVHSERVAGCLPASLKGRADVDVAGFEKDL
jgi:hypothetical protein